MASGSADRAAVRRPPPDQDERRPDLAGTEAVDTGTGSELAPDVELAAAAAGTPAEDSAGNGRLPS